MKHTFLKHALWAALFAAGAAMAQDAAISGADFTHGKADAQLAAIGGKAAADGQTVVVTAPTYWQGKVAAKIRAGAHGKAVPIRFSTGFYENVLVRTEASAPVAAAAKPEPKAAVKPEPKSQPKIARAEPTPQAKSAMKPVAAAAPASAAAAPPVAHPPVATAMVMQAPVQQPATVSPQPAAPQVASNLVAVPQVSQQPAVVPIPTAAIITDAGKPVTQEPAANANASERQRMLASLNDDRPASGSLTEAQLQAGDQVYSDHDVLAVVRLDGLHRSLYWLQGPVDLQRVQFMPHGNGHYEVTGPIDPKVPAAHRSDSNAHHVVTSGIPASGSAVRARLEQQYNNGQPITNSLDTAQLQLEDRLLLDHDTILVVRRDGGTMTRYWLDGSVDLNQSGVQKVDANVYRVAGNHLH